MPRYEFRCLQCGYEFEEDRRVEDPCPPCALEREDSLCMGETEKLISQNTFHLKGSGWAKDGY